MYDVTNALLRCDFWNLADFDFSNKKVIPDCKIDVEDKRPFGEALPIDILVDPDDRGKSFCYIDDLITVGIKNMRVDKLRYAVALVIDLFRRRLDLNEPIHRDDLLSMKKLQAEGALEECKTILGWFFDFRTLMVFLPDDKYFRWSALLQQFLDDKKARIKDIDSAVGRNRHACQILKLSHHFQNRLRRKVDHRKNGNTIVQFNERELEDIRLWKKMMSRANQGISFNLIVYRAPTKLYLSDSCPYGLGGFSVLRGRA